MARRFREEHEGLLLQREDDIELERISDRALDLPTLRSSPSRSWYWWSSRKPLSLLLGSITARDTPDVSTPHRTLTAPDSRNKCSRHRTCWKWLQAFLVATFVLSISCAIFFPSYTRAPPHYKTLRQRVDRGWTEFGKANTNNEKIFIAASLYDPRGQLISGDWGDSVQGLIRILGPRNVHLSIYENDIDDANEAALAEFEKSLLCNNTIVREDLDLFALPHVTTQQGVRRLKRVQFLAVVRNRALSPLQTLPTRFDKLLYINDVIFDPIDAANLLFSTNVDETGRTQYRAACAVDFENPFKFYDTFATRDAEGHDMGVIFYPWFTSAGEGRSRREVLAQKDAVTVSSCWGGMVAFEAKWFQYSQASDAQDAYGVQLPLRFRAENDTYWDASECCLIHADLTAVSSTHGNETGIFMNPYIRVAYSKAVLDWLWLTRRFERLYTAVQSLVNWIGGRPTFNPRRLEKPGQEITDDVWRWDPETQAAIQNNTTDHLVSGMHGMFKKVRRRASPGSFCGYRSLSYLLEDPSKSGKKWAHEEIPID